MESRKSLFRKVERAIEAIERSSDASSTIAETASAVIENFKDELGVTGGRLYERRDGGYELTRVFGGAAAAPGIFVPDAYPPVQQVVDEGVVLMDLTAPGVDPEFERKLGVDRFAAIAVGDDEYILSFSVDPVAPDDDLMASLGILRHAVDQKLREERFLSVLIEARQIQMSILPKRSPRRGEFEIAGFTVPAEIVGGDFFDFIPVTDRIQGIAIADASGHGLPAALQVRDVYTGLRMGVARDFKIVRTVERLNRIIHQSRMTTKFVSLFYGEFETNGDVVYVNAGHPPPIHLHAASGSFRELETTGMVLGPAPDVVYGRRAIHMEPGDLVLLYTDGVVEAHDPKGREFGAGRLRRLLGQARRESAREIVQRVVNAARSWSHGAPAEDDVTAVVIRRDPSRLAGPAGVRPGASTRGTTPPSG